MVVIGEPRMNFVLAAAFCKIGVAVTAAETSVRMTVIDAKAGAIR